MSATKSSEGKRQIRLVDADWLAAKLRMMQDKLAELQSQPVKDEEAIARLSRTIQAFSEAYFRSLACPDYLITLLPISEEEFILDGELVNVTGLFYWLETGRLSVGGHTPHQMCLFLRGWAKSVDPQKMQKDLDAARSSLRSLKENFGFRPQ